MPITPARTFEGEEKPLKVEWADDVVNLTYNPNRVTGELLQSIAEMDSDRRVGTLAAQVCAVVTSWDVLERDPEPDEATDDVPRYPLEPTQVAKLGAAFLGALLEAVQEDQRPPAKTGSFGG